MRCIVLITLVVLFRHPNESKGISPQALSSMTGGISFETPERESCKCVPFYKCGYNHAKRSNSCGSTEVCCRNDSPADDVCGWGAAAEENGHDAEYGEFPWMVAILDVNTAETWRPSEYVGGGAIICPKVVLTAAHKVDGKQAEMLKCRAGVWDLLKNEQNTSQERLVEKLYIHPNYERLYTANDVALLFLKKEFDVSLPTVRPVCVGKGAPPQGSKCFAMGWGRSTFDSNNYAEKLKKVSTPLLPRNICWRALQAVDAARQKEREKLREKSIKSWKTVQGALEKEIEGAGQEGCMQQERTKFMLHSSLLCAGGEGEDTCTGDGGSPLVCQLQMNATHTRYAVYGLVAWGIGCGAPGSPGVYVDVAQFYDWILRQIGPGYTGVPLSVVASRLG